MPEARCTMKSLPNTKFSFLGYFSLSPLTSSEFDFRMVLVVFSNKRKCAKTLSYCMYVRPLSSSTQQTGHCCKAKLATRDGTHVWMGVYYIICVNCYVLYTYPKI